MLCLGEDIYYFLGLPESTSKNCKPPPLPQKSRISKRTNLTDVLGKANLREGTGFCFLLSGSEATSNSSKVPSEVFAPSNLKAGKLWKSHRNLLPEFLCWSIFVVGIVSVNQPKSTNVLDTLKVQSKLCTLSLDAILSEPVVWRWAAGPDILALRQNIRSREQLWVIVCLRCDGRVRASCK